MEQKKPEEITKDFFDSLFEEDVKTPPLKEENLPSDKKEEEVSPLLQEENKEEVINEEIPEKPSVYKERIKSFIDAGLIQDISITVDDEEKYLSELDIEDEDTYKELLNQIKKEADEKIKQNYISKEGLDEITQKIIEIRKSGGDITEVLSENVKAIDQLSHLQEILDNGDDKEKENISINILAHNLREKGLTDRVIQAQIQDYIENGVLEEQASKVLEYHMDIQKEQIEIKKQAELDRIQKEKEDLKQFKKELSLKYKSWSIPENIQKILVDNATKGDEYQVTNTDKIYFEVKAKNPELFAKVNYLLNNPQEFEKWISHNKVLENKKQEFKSKIILNTNKIKQAQKNEGDFFEELFKNK